MAQVILCSKPYESWKYLDRPAGSGNDSCKKSGALRYVDAMAVELCVRGCLMLYRQRTSKYYDLYKKKTATENV